MLGLYQPIQTPCGGARNFHLGDYSLILVLALVGVRHRRVDFQQVKSILERVSGWCSG